MNEGESTDLLRVDTDVTVSWAEAAFLGFVQGMTEFLPVSSSAHLRIVGPLLPSGGDPGAAFRLVSTRGYMPFVIYRIALGAPVLALLDLDVLSAT